MQFNKLDVRKCALGIVMGVCVLGMSSVLAIKTASAKELKTRGLAFNPASPNDMAKRHQQRLEAMRKARLQRIEAMNKARQAAILQNQERQKLRQSLRAKAAKAKGKERIALQRKLQQVTFSRAAADQELKKMEERKAKAAAARKASRIGTKGAGKGRYSALIAKHARASGVPVALAHAVVFSESRYRANARGRAGEIGLMQIKPSTARGMGYRGSAKGLYNPDTNLRWGMKYLARAHRLSGGSICGTILKYNAGHGARRMNPTSRRYCSKVRRLMR